MAEVMKHNKPEDMWTVLGGKVYNVTSYAKQHPGGSMIIKSFAGKDMTKEYCKPWRSGSECRPMPCIRERRETHWTPDRGHAQKVTFT